MAHLNNQRSKWLLGCGSAALAMGLALMPSMASAQAIQATDSVQSGSATRIITGSTTEIISVSTDTAVIDWTPLEDGQGNALDFLPTGHEVEFRSVTDFAVLNRILPSANGNIAVFDGTVITQVGEGGSGGTVAFYSPTGILVGSNAVFDVGNLILTTLDVDLASFDDFAINGGALALGGQPTTARIEISPGAQILASAENSFFAVTAAEIQMFGTSNVNGSQAYVAGETVNITVSNGLFDIQIPVGTTVAQPIVFNGNVGGPSSTGVGDNHLIYAVAAAQNDPISLLFSGNLGFAPASSAGIVNGEIILSANYDVFGRNVNGGSIGSGLAGEIFDANAEVSSASGNIAVEDVTATSSLLAIANDEVEVTTIASASSFAGDLHVIGGNLAEVTTGGVGFDLFVEGDLYVLARSYGSLIDPNNIDAVAGSASLEAIDGGNITVGRNVLVSADAIGGIDLIGQITGSATAGSASLVADGGNLTIAGRVEVSANASFAGQEEGFLGADAIGGNVQFLAANGGIVTIDDAVLLTATGSSFLPTSTSSNVFGGVVSLTATSGASIFLNGLNSIPGEGFAGPTLIIDSSAFAGASTQAGQGAIADAGQSTIALDGGSLLDVVGDVNLFARGQGGSNEGGEGGDGLGGVAVLSVAGLSNIQITNAYVADASGIGGDSDILAGDGFGGVAGASVFDGSLDIGFSASAIAEGIGGGALVGGGLNDGVGGLGGDGGDGIGGRAFFEVFGSIPDPTTLTVGGTLGVSADGLGGDGGNGGLATGPGGGLVAPGSGGAGTAGQGNTNNQADNSVANGAYVLVNGDNAAISVVGLSTVQANGVGGFGGLGDLGQNGGAGGSAFGGTAQVGLGQAAGQSSVANFGDVTIMAIATGGEGGLVSFPTEQSGNGGDANGGTATLFVNEGTATAGATILDASANAGSGEVGGVGIGGTAQLLGQTQSVTGNSTTLGTLEIIASGLGGFGESVGGDSVGGVAEINLLNSSLAVINSGVRLISGNDTTTGGVGSTVAGNVTGGFALVSVAGSASVLDISGGLELNASQTAQDSATLGQGARATAGVAEFLLDSGASALINGNLTLNASAIGGNNTLGQGGDAFGGIATATVDGGASLQIIGDVDAMAAANTGGNKANGVGGGHGFGGVAGISVRTGSIDILGNVTADASGRGGNASFGFGGDGGDAEAGRAFIEAQGTLADAASLIIGGDARALSFAESGRGGDGDGAGIAAGRGGTGIGGRSSTFNQADNSVTNGAYILGGADNATLIVSGETLAAASGAGDTPSGGDGGAGQAGGDGPLGFGGTAQVGQALFSGDGSLGLGTASFGDVVVYAGSFAPPGGDGGSASDPFGAGGIAVGGDATFVARAGTVTANSVTINADAFAVGGSSTGGNATLLGELGATMTINDLFVSASGVSAGGFGVGGVGFGGAAEIILNGSSLNITGTNNVVLRSNGVAELEGDPFSSGAFVSGLAGDVIGGVTRVSVTGSDSVLNIASGLTLDASPIGQASDAAGQGASVTGGTAELFLDAGAIAIIGGDLLLSANGLGGTNSVGQGGDGIGGAARTRVDNGASLDLGGNYRAEATGQGGAGAIRGGDGFGGIAGLSIGTGVVNILGSADAVATGFGGFGATLGLDDSLTQGGDGGDGTGGNAFLQADGSATGTATLIIALDASANASGTGGDAGDGDGGALLPGRGGNGTGGQGGTPNQADPIFNSGAFVLAGGDNGNISVGGLTTITANGLGGAGGVGGFGQAGGDGGDGLGGLANGGQSPFGGDGSIAAGTATFADLSIFSTGLAGQGGLGGSSGDLSGIGGNAIGGTAGLTAFAGVVNAGNVVINTSSFGANGEGGGDATGGDAAILGQLGATINLVSVALSSTGGGGFGNSLGGDGIGGISRIDLDEASLIITDAATDLDLRASGQAGGAAAGAAGASSGGTARISLSGSAAQLTLPAGLLLEASTLSTQSDFAGQAAAANGGVAEFILDNGASATILGDLTLNASADGGFNSQGQGGDAQAGDINVTITNSTIAGGDLFVTATAFGGESATQAGNAIGGNIVFTLSDTVINAGAMSINATAVGGDGDEGTGPTGNGGNAQGGSVVVDATSSSINLLGSLSVQAEGFGGHGLVGGDAFGGSAQLNLAQTDIFVGLDANQISNISVISSAMAGQDGNELGDAIAGSAGLQMVDSTIDAVGLNIISDADGVVGQGNPLANGGLAAAGQVDAIIEGASSISVDTFALSARANSVENGFANGGQVNLLLSGGSGAPDVTVQLLNINVNAEGADGLGTPASTAGVFDVQVLAGQMNLVTFNGSALGDLLDGAGGPSSLTATGGSILISGAMNIDVLGDLDITTGQASIIGGPTIDSPTAQITIRANTVRIDGDDDNFTSFGGDQMTIESFDIEVLDGARFGANTLNLVSRDLTNPAFLGGASGPVNSDPTLGYVLSQEEAERIEVNNFFFLQPTLGGGAPSDPDIIIGDLLANGDFDEGVANITVGTSGTGGIIRIEGAVSFFDADTINTLTFNADERIEIITPGSLAIVDTSGAPTGLLSLNSGNIWVADAALIAQLQADPNFAGRNAELADAIAGSDDPLGYVRAGTVNIEVGNSLNTGTTAQPGGILVGSGGLSITAPPAQSGALDIFAYGARLDGTGALVTGEAFFNEINFNIGTTN